MSKDNVFDCLSALLFEFLAVAVHFQSAIR